MTKLINIAVNSCRECNYLRSNIGTGYTCLKLEDSKEFEPEFDFIKIHERCTLPDGTITIESMVGVENLSTDTITQGAQKAGEQVLEQLQFALADLQATAQ